VDEREQLFPHLQLVAERLRLSAVYITPNGRFWLNSYARLLTDLYVAEGLR
jgi:hypothetical protein